MFLVTAKQMQAMDKKTIETFGIPGRVLMENAGRGAFDFLCTKVKDIHQKQIAVLAGTGNNGGDGFVIARYLMEKKCRVTVFLLSTKEKLTGDARANMELTRKLCDMSDTCAIIEIPDADTFRQNQNCMHNHDIFIDAILGTGLNSDVRGFFKKVIEWLNTVQGFVFSIDISSGLHSDTGQPLGIAVKADATAAFAFAKTGQVIFPGNTCTGDLKVIDIGIPWFIAIQEKLTNALITKKKAAFCFSPRKFSSHKGSYGHLLVAAGAMGKTGAAALCANAAMRCGTGLVTLGIAKSLNKIIESQVVEPMTFPLPEKKKGILSIHCLDKIMSLLKDKQALAVGPGIGTRKSTRELVRALIENSNVPIVIDADAINCIATAPEILKNKNVSVILTPHPGEMARLCHKTTQQVQADRMGIASAFARDFDSILILKGAQTIVSLPDGRSFICPTGNPGMASGGMGDVLTGMIAGFLAQGFTPENAGIAGVFIHGMCGDILAENMGAFGFLASDMIQMIPEVIHNHLL